ncbi:MAG TPA: phospholipase [Solirubrobacteraceae bacterium]|nr:phospholipase [Solirubrobacteraceae bacterium]
MSELHYRERAPAGEAEGLLVLSHGRGSDELDLLGLADLLDPGRRLLVVSPRAPLQLEGSPGYHWYLVPRVGYPDPVTFASSYRSLAELHEQLWRDTGLGPEQTLLGGFSMGAVMSYALGLGADRPRPGGILAFSGFVPTTEGWQPGLEQRRGLPVFISHGSRDPVISVEFAREAERRLTQAGLEVSYHEFESAHHIDPRHLPLAAAWIERALAAAGTRESA